MDFPFTLFHFQSQKCFTLIFEILNAFLMQCCGARRWTFGEGQEGAKVEREEEKGRRWGEMPKPLNPIEAQLQSFPQPAFRKIYQKSKKRPNFTLTTDGLNCGHKFVANTFYIYSPTVGENSPPL